MNCKTEEKDPARIVERTMEIIAATKHPLRCLINEKAGGKSNKT